MRKLTVLSLGGLVLVLAGCATVSNPSAVNPDSDLEQSIKAKLASDPAIQTANLGVSANAARSEVTLSGTVPSEELRSRAVELAKTVQPALTVTDKIEVKPPQVAGDDSRDGFTEDKARAARERAKELGDQVGRSLDDAWIYTKIVTRLATDPDTSAVKVNVDVKDKAVTLRGRVASPTAKAESERLARDTEGVASVRDLVVVGSAGTSSRTE